MRVLSLFDGMACGMIAFKVAGIPIDSYDAYEIDKFAVQVATHNFPEISEHGDVFDADFTNYEGVDYVIGGSPCTYWSIAQSPDKRETTASGIGWELFSQYVRAIKEAKPKYFIYENNKSMAKAIYDSISTTFGFEPIMINSALVSAQNRQRLYWVGKRNEDGTYSKIDVRQPEDRGIYLRDILDSGVDLTSRDKSFACTTRCNGATPEDVLTKHRHSMVAERISDKAQQVGALPRPNGELSTSQAFRVYSVDAKSVTIKAGGGGAGGKTGLYAVPKPVCVASRGVYSDGKRDGSLSGTPTTQRVEMRGDGSKTNALTTVSKDNLIMEPLRYPEATKLGYVEVQPMECLDITAPNSQRRGRLMTTKSNTLTSSNQFYEYMGTTNIYEVEDGQIEVKGKKYPIKLSDGLYVVRKLSVDECKRLQTVPDWYDMSCISNSQAYKCLGNGWTIEVIAHLIRATQEGKTEAKQLTFWEV